MRRKTGVRSSGSVLLWGPHGILVGKMDLEFSEYGQVCTRFYITEGTNSTYKLRKT